MPELSERQRERLVELEPWLSSARLIDALERKWEVHFRCLECGATKTWRRDTMLGRAQKLLGRTFAEIQRMTPCPRCGRHRPAIRVAGVIDPGHDADLLRYELINTLLEAGLKPTDYGIGWKPPAERL